MEAPHPFGLISCFERYPSLLPQSGDIKKPIIDAFSLLQSFHNKSGEINVETQYSLIISLLNYECNIYNYE